MAPGHLQSRASGSLRLILARESPALHLLHVHFPKAGFELKEPQKLDPLRCPGSGQGVPIASRQRIASWMRCRALGWWKNTNSSTAPGSGLR